MNHKFLIWIFLIGILIISSVYSQDVKSLNLQYHYDFRREFPTVTQEFYGTDKLGYTFFFMDLNFDHNRKQGGVSDIYFEILRYFKIYSWNDYDLFATVQYDDGTAPVERILLAGLNIGNVNIGPFNVSTEFLLKKDYKLDVNWQYTVVWYAEFLNGQLIFNGFLDYWANDVDNSRWPSFNPEFAASNYSFQAEPQVGWRISPHWKIGSEVEIDRGFIGTVTGKLALEEEYQHDKWYFLPTLFVQYDF